MHTHPHRRRFAAGAAVLLAGLLAGGCKTPLRGRETPLTEQELKLFYARAKDARQWWLTVYDSPDGPVFSGGNRLHNGHVFSGPFHGPRKSVAPVVACHIGTPARSLALFDTTSADCWIAFPAAVTFRASPLGPPAYRILPPHVSTALPGYLTVLPKLRFEGLQIDELLVYVRAARRGLGPLARDAASIKPSLVIGTGLLRRFAFVQFNFPKRTLIVSTSDRYRTVPERIVARLPVRERQGALAVPISLDGTPRMAVIDTAGDYGLVQPVGTPRLVRRLDIGNLAWLGVTADRHADHGLTLTEYPHVGLGLLSDYIVTLDNETGHLLIERP